MNSWWSMNKLLYCKLWFCSNNTTSGLLRLQVYALEIILARIVNHSGRGVGGILKAVLVGVVYVPGGKLEPMCTIQFQCTNELILLFKLKVHSYITH